MAIRGTAKTLTGDVFNQLRDQILSGALEPGQRLRPSELRLTYNVSIGVVREALTRLTEQQLVVAEPNQGFSVPQLTRANLIALTEARAEIEGYALRLSIERGDVDWEAAVISAHHKLERTPIRQEDGSVNPAWQAPHAAFHAALRAGCDNPILLALCASLFQSSELYRRWSEPQLVLRDAEDEHREIAAAAVARDTDRAVELLRRHFELTRDLALQNIAALRSDDPSAAQAAG